MGTLYLLAEYGRAKTVDFTLVEVDGVDLRTDAADGGDDIKIMKDEGAEASTTNNFTDEGQGYAVVLTATEIQAARIKGYIVDTATKVWLDTDFLIETYGHPSSAHPYLSKYWTNGAVNDGSASSTVWTFDGFTEATADHVIGSELTFTRGANAGQCRTVTDYTSTVITVSPAFLAAPADNDEFVLEARPTTSAGNVPAVDIASILTDTAEIGTAGAGLTNINLPNQTMDITGDLSGSVGSVTGAVGSVTGDIGGIVANGLTNDAFADGAIDAAVLATDTITAAKIAANAIGASELATDAIGAAQLAADAIDEIWDEAMVASTGAPAITGSMRAFMEWWATLSRNVVNQTATTTTVRNDADDGDISTSTVSDDGTTFVRGEFST